MDPNHNIGTTGPGNFPGPNGLANMNLPPQDPELPRQAGLRPEAGPLTAEAAPAPAAPPPAGAMTWLPPSVPVSPAGASAGAAAGQAAVVSAPADADDTDLIEKEWVMKAKQIVEQTKQDPYKQTKELHKFRADYMKKRYNKMIEPVEE